MKLCALFDKYRISSTADNIFFRQYKNDYFAFIGNEFWSFRENFTPPSIHQTSDLGAPYYGHLPLLEMVISLVSRILFLYK